MTELSEDTALVVIDVQEGFDDPKWGRRNNPAAEENIATLLAAWRAARLPIFHVRHLSLAAGSPLGPGEPGSKIKAIAAPLGDEPVLSKNVNSAFIGTDLEQRLRRAGIGRLVIAGLTTDHCVSTTARMAANLGFAVTCVSDATATFERRGPDGKHYSAQLMHDVSLASLNDEFTTIARTADVVAVLLRFGAVVA